MKLGINKCNNVYKMSPVFLYDGLYLYVKSVPKNKFLSE